MAENRKSAPPTPANRDGESIQDLTRHFAELSAKAPVNDALKTAFLRGKLLIAHTDPQLNIASRELAVKNMAERVGLQHADVLSGPVPGGVGYGVFYTPAFKTNWGRGTSLAFDIIAPTSPGGNVSTWLYLTAMNRSAMGIEAFLSYNGQADTHFLVFDWARNDHWQTNIPLSGLNNYLRTESAHGHPYQVLPVWNSTWRLNESSWRNQALLYNHVRGGWDLVYQYDYAATDAQQKTGWTGSWAPIVETFQSAYSGTSPMGALNTQLVSADNTGIWGTWAWLSSSNSTIRTDNVGFHLAFLDPNYAFAVNS